MSTSENYIGQNGFLKNHHDIIITSIATTTTLLDNWNKLDNYWAVHFLREGKREGNDFLDLKNKVTAERLRYAKTLKIFWQKIIKKYEKNSISAHSAEKENLVPANSSHSQNIIENSDKNHFIPIENQSIFNSSHSSNSSHSKENIEIPIKDHSISTTKDHFIFTKDHSISTENHSKNSQLINFCYDILQELDIKSNIHPFYEYNEEKISNKFIKNPMDLFTIISKLKNNQYASIEEFENDIRLIFRNCYIYNDIGSEMHILGEELESTFNKIWTEKIGIQVKQKENLKRTRDNDTDLSFELVTKQIKILEQNRDKLVYGQVVNDALLIISAYENLVADNIIPFIELLKTFLLTRSQISLSSADESVLQAIVENLLPLKYCIPELSLVMDGTKLKGFGRFGYSDIFILKGIGNNNIKEVLNNGINQLKSYMNIISKGKPIDYYSSGIFDKRIKITKSNPNKLRGFVVLNQEKDNKYNTVEKSLEISHVIDHMLNILASTPIDIRYHSQHYEM
ncbi:bromodomain-containing protein [Rhizophagus irregularis DAOM 181602=DAOM 197198]|nr:bromodomain-containing protein [Rhizophagus irregularis DAOM 181602=DAOM 197198]